MDKLWILIAFLIVVGLVSLGIGAYCYHALSDIYRLFGDYGVPENHVLAHPEAPNIIFRLKAEVIVFAIFGFLSWLFAGLLTFLLRNTKSHVS